MKPCANAAPITMGRAMTKQPKSGLELLRDPFPAHQISKLPKPTKAQTDAVKADFKVGIRCQLCGAWHHKDVVHLDYVGHAALTDRLLDADPSWHWEPAALRDGLPAFDVSGGLWIKLTVCGVSRLGYGHAAAKPGQDPGAREKEVIGDALRNAAMRFGAALDLWHKGDLHGDDDDTPKDEPKPRNSGPSDAQIAHDRAVIDAHAMIESAESLADLQSVWKGIAKDVQADPRVIEEKDKTKARLTPKHADDLGGDDIPY
jgi:hypothetical protein